MVPPDRLPLGAIFGLQDHRSHGEFELVCAAQHQRGVEDTGDRHSPLIRVEGGPCEVPIPLMPIVIHDASQRP